MDTIIDFLVELFFEIFGEGFVSLCSAFVPSKAISKKWQKIIGAVCIIISLILLIGLFVGIILLVETYGKSFWGWLLISLNIVYLISGVTMKIVELAKRK